MLGQPLKRQDNKNNKHPIDRDLLSFLQIYLLLKNKDNMGRSPFIPTGEHDVCMKERNDKLRNLMMHFILQESFIVKEEEESLLRKLELKMEKKSPK